MSAAKPSAYAAAGVDIDAQEKGLARVKKLAKSTFTPGVLTEIGSFGGLFRPELTGMTEPVLVASADGVEADAGAEYPGIVSSSAERTRWED